MKVSHSHQCQLPDQPDAVSRSLLQDLSEFLVTLSSGESVYIVAADSMDAAYCALELSEDTGTTLIDLEELEKEKSVFPEQLE